MYKMDNWVFSRLSEPFAENEIHWRVGGGGTILAYIDARQVVERLNYVVGSENWSDAYDPIVFTNTEVKENTDYDALRKKYEEQGAKLYEVFWMKGNAITGVKNKADMTFGYNDVKYGGIRCSLTVLDVTRQDVGTVSMADQIKGAHSDALKRAAVKFGIGVYLYDLKNLQGGFFEKGVVVEPPELPSWAVPVERGNPDDALLGLFEEARKQKNINLIHVENLYKEISVMGNYDYSASLIAKRSVYERLRNLMDDPSSVKDGSDL